MPQLARAYLRAKGILRLACPSRCEGHAPLRVCDFFEFMTSLSSLLFCLQPRFLTTSKKSQTLRMTVLIFSPCHELQFRFNVSTLREVGSLVTMSLGLYISVPFC